MKYTTAWIIVRKVVQLAKATRGVILHLLLRAQESQAMLVYSKSTLKQELRVTFGARCLLVSKVFLKKLCAYNVHTQGKTSP